MPVLERSHTENLAALRTHFNAQKSKYGRQVIVSLVEQTGREAIVGSAYRQYVEELSDEQVKFVDFDIHQGTQERERRVVLFLQSRVSSAALTDHRMSRYALRTY